jgi:hypothetical protein
VLSLAAALLSFSLHTPPTVVQPPLSLPAGWHEVAGWDELTPGQKDRALHNYQNYMALPPDKKHDIDQRYERWKNLPNNDRDRYRKKHDEYRGRGLVDE